jgi:polysaccharide biosynthesis transport protein
MNFLFRSFWAKLAVSLIILAAVALIGWVLPITPPAVFDVAARIWVQSKVSSDVGENRQSNSLFQSFMTYFNSPILTACEVLKSSLVLEEAVSELKAKLPADQVPTLGDLKAGVGVEPVRDTDILAITYHSTDANVGIQTVQAILDSFLKLQTHQTTYSAIQSKTFLLKQLEDANKELKHTDEQIKTFQIKNGAVDLQGQVSEMLKRRSSTEQALKEAEAKAQEDNQKVNFLQARLGINADDALSVNAMATDPMIAEGRKRLIELEAQYSELSTNYRPEHPQMRRLQSLITQLKKTSTERLDSMLSDAGIASGGAASKSLSHMHEDMMKEMVSARSDEMAQQNRAVNLRPALENIDAQISKLPEKQLELADLLRAQKVIFEQISTLEANISAAKLIEAVNTHTPSFQIIDRPQVIDVEVASRRPKFLTASMLGLFLAVASFFLLDRMDPRLRRIGAVLDTLPLPVVGWINPLPTELNPATLESMHKLQLSLRSWFTKDSRQLVVASADKGDGKTIISATLAIGLGQSGFKVLLVDTNLDSPALPRVFRTMTTTVGLSDYLASPSPELWAQILQPLSKNLNVIAAGSRSALPGMFLSSDNISHFIEKALTEADIVIYNTPNAGDSANALALIAENVNLLVVVRMNHTHLPNLRLFSRELKQHQFSSGGICLVNADPDAVATALAKNEKVGEPEPA